MWEAYISCYTCKGLSEGADFRLGTENLPAACLADLKNRPEIIDMKE